MGGYKKILSVISGVVTGIVNGLFGGGGGMIVVPILTHLLKKSEREAHATAILVILPITIVSAVNYYISEDINIKRLIFVSMGVLVGGVVGAYILPKISNKILTLIFAVIIIASGFKMAF